MYAAIKDAIAKSVPVVMTWRVPNGRVLPNNGWEGGGKTLVDAGAVMGDDLSAHFLILDEAITRLGSIGTRYQRIVELRYMAWPNHSRGSRSPQRFTGNHRTRMELRAGLAPARAAIRRSRG